MRVTFSTITVALLLFAAFTSQPCRAADASAEADQAWQDVIRSGELPRPPEAWQKKEPTPQEIDQFRSEQGDRLFKAASKALAFQAKFPGDARIDEARAKEYELLQVATQLGNTNALNRLDTIDQAKLADPKTTEEERFQLRASAVNRKAMSRLTESRAAAFDELEKGARSLLKEFPKRTEGYEMLMAVASEAESEKARQLAKELADSSAPEPIKAGAKDLLKRMDRLGKPVALKFKSVDGGDVDLAKLKGKVVLVDFWATWCGPCVREVPNVVAAYQKLQPEGFEIIGISFDQDKDKLLNFVKQNKMNWVQYFDGKGWENAFGKEFGIQSIPTMWLLDKKGNLRDLNAREDLVVKVEKLLAENL